MENSLPARPSLEQLKKQAKDLVKAHELKQPAALAMIRAHLPAASGLAEDQIAQMSFALHDAQSVVARQHGLPSWNELRETVEQSGRPASELQAPANVQATLDTALKARGRFDYAVFSTVCSPQFLALVTKERFEAASQRMDVYFKESYRLTYMGEVKNLGRLVYFWKLWVPGWDSDILVRMALNDAGKISGLLYSPPFDNARRAPE